MAHVWQSAVLALVVVPALRLAADRSFRRVFPYDAARISALAAAYLAVLTLAAAYRPHWLEIPAVVAASAAAVFFWRVRPGYGRASRLPPGSLWPFPVGPWANPDFYAERAARYGDVFKMCQFGRPMVCVLGLERADRLLLHSDDRLEAPPLPFSRFIEGGYLRYLPEEVHARYRKLFHSVFHSPALENATPRLREVFRRGFRRMADETATVGSVRVKNAVLRTMFEAWTELFYGIGREHPDFERLERLFRVIDTRKARWARRRRVQAALGEIEKILAERRATLTREDVAHPASFLAALEGGNSGALADRTVLGNLIYIMQVTWGDVGGLLLWIFKMLSDNPRWQPWLADDPGLERAAQVVDETLRLEQSESRYRRATDDLEIDGFRIPKGWLVRMCVRESHRDARTFPDPAAFDPQRFSGRTYSRTEYGPFGAFRLACIGENVARAAGAIFAFELAHGFEWKVLEDGPPGISSWVHNAPNPLLRVALAAKGGS